MTETLDVGLLLLRLVLAALLTGHACQKLFGWFRGQGVAGTGRMFEDLGFRPGPLMVVVAGVSELTGAALLATGFLVPLGGAIVVGTMVVAASANASNGLWAHLGGYEVALAYGLVALVLVLTGPGGLSLDHALGLAWDGRWVAAGIVLGLVSPVPVLVRRARTSRTAAG